MPHKDGDTGSSLTILPWFNQSVSQTYLPTKTHPHRFTVEPNTPPTRRRNGHFYDNQNNHENSRNCSPNNPTHHHHHSLRTKRKRRVPTVRNSAAARLARAGHLHKHLNDPNSRHSEPKGIVSSESITREVQIATAITVCAAELQGQRPPNLPDENCFLDEFDAYVFKYYLEPLKKSQTWRAERAYATLACTPIGADKQTN